MPIIYNLTPFYLVASALAILWFRSIKTCLKEEIIFKEQALVLNIVFFIFFFAFVKYFMIEFIVGSLFFLLFVVELILELNEIRNDGGGDDF